VLYKTGSGTLTLPGANSFSGATTMNNGMLVLANTSGSALGTSSLTLMGGTLATVPGLAVSVSGNVWAGTAPSAAAYQIAPGGIGSIGTLSIGGQLGLSSNSTLDFSISGTSSSLLNVVGALSETGTATIDLNTSGNLSPSYTLATFGGNNSSQPLAFTVVGAPQNYVLSIGSNDLVLGPAGAPTWTSTASGSWNTGSNWSSTPVPNGQGQTAIVNASAGTAVAITLDAPQTLGTLVLGDSSNSSTAFTLSAGANGSLTMANTGTSPALITVTGGTQTIAANVALAGSLTIVPTANSTLVISGSVNESTSGTGVLELTDAGTLILSGSNNFSSMVVTNGTLVLMNNEALAGGTSLTIGDASAFAGGPTGANPGAISSGLNAPLADHEYMVPAPSITPVPEPGTLVLVTAGAFAGLATWRRRRNRGD
jgi:autotransporter-associated beta strand protein